MTDQYPALELTQRQLILLRVVWSHGPASGSELRSPVDDATGAERYHHGQFYENLAELEESGYLEKRQRDGRTNEYAVTHEGAKVLWDVSAWIVDDR